MIHFLNIVFYQNIHSFSDVIIKIVSNVNLNLEKKIAQKI